LKRRDLRQIQPQTTTREKQTGKVTLNKIPRLIWWWKWIMTFHWLMNYKPFCNWLFLLVDLFYNLFFSKSPIFPYKNHNNGWTLN
jgi:hypothetical protein